jgi:hypothetical protein
MLPIQVRHQWEKQFTLTIELDFVTINILLTAISACFIVLGWSNSSV